MSIKKKKKKTRIEDFDVTSASFSPASYNVDWGGTSEHLYNHHRTMHVVALSTNVPTSPDPLKQLEAILVKHATQSCEDQ